MLPTKTNPSVRIAIDIRTLCDGNSGTVASGIQVFLLSVLDQLQKLDSTNEYILFETQDSFYPVTNKNWKKLVLPTFKIPGILWQQIVFPFYLLKHDIQVLWSPKFICPIFLFKKVHRLTTIHDLVFLHFPKTIPFKALLQFRFFIPLSAKKSSTIFTDSTFIKGDFENHFRSIKAPVIAVPLGKPLWKIPASYRPEERNNFLFFAGNLEPRKNLYNAIRALEILFKKGLSVELQIASPATWKNNAVLNAIERSPVKSHITMLGYITQDELKKKYLSCKAFLYPSFYEGFGLPVLEALSMDCLVLTSKNSVMQEVAGEAAMYFDPYNPEDMADKIQMIFAMDFDRTITMDKKESVLEKYTWEKTAGKILYAINSDKR